VQNKAAATDLTETGPTQAKAGPSYQAPALEKGLAILELLASVDQPLSRTDIARRLNRSVGEIYRMLHQLVQQNYVTSDGEHYFLTTKLFELAHQHPPTQRLLSEALPLMQALAAKVDQSCHLTLYNQGKQIVVAKVDVPSGMGFSVRLGSELDVLVSASGRVLIAFQDASTQAQRIEECALREPEIDLAATEAALGRIRTAGYEAAPSGQVRGLFAISFPILDLRHTALAALTVPYADRIDLKGRATISDVETALGETARTLTARVSGT
jgi:DNA-binding IclR family transcriptional regulator